MVHARPAYRPGLRRRAGHTRDLAALVLRTGVLTAGPLHRLPRHLGELRRWGTTLAGLVVAAAVRDPGRTALIDDSGALTYAELDDRTARLAAGLPLSGPRPRVGVLCRNHRGMVETLVACGRRGAEVVLLNTGLGVGQLRAVLGELRVDVLVADAEFADLVMSAPPGLRRTVVWADHAPDPPPPLTAPVPAHLTTPDVHPAPPRSATTGRWLADPPTDPGPPAPQPHAAPRTTGPLPTTPDAHPPGPSPAEDRSRPSGPFPVADDGRASGAFPVVGDGRSTGPFAAVGEGRGTGPFAQVAGRRGIGGGLTLEEIVR
ncbi:MAG TPA: AMP-binding protein, partial [Thermomonospora sp.]|nr:AMP-binding protein [Thermomonospora sp.]